MLLTARVSRVGSDGRAKLLIPSVLGAAESGWSLPAFEGDYKTGDTVWAIETDTGDYTFLPKAGPSEVDEGLALD
jgi:hypothetical protein